MGIKMKQLFTEIVEILKDIRSEIKYQTGILKQLVPSEESNRTTIYIAGRVDSHPPTFVYRTGFQITGKGIKSSMGTGSTTENLLVSYLRGLYAALQQAHLYPIKKLRIVTDSGMLHQYLTDGLTIGFDVKEKEFAAMLKQSLTKYKDVKYEFATSISSKIIKQIEEKLEEEVKEYANSQRSRNNFTQREDNRETT